MAMRGKEPAAMPPEQWPDLLAVGLWQRQRIECGARVKKKSSFAHRWRRDAQPGFYLKQEHEPVRLARVTVFADKSGEVQFAGREGQAEFLLGLADGTSVRRFAEIGPELSPGRAPQAAIRLPRAFEQQHLVVIVEAIKQGRDSVRQRHAREWNRESTGRQAGRRSRGPRSRGSLACPGKKQKAPGRAMAHIPSLASSFSSAIWKDWTSAAEGL